MGRLRTLRSGRVASSWGGDRRCTRFEGKFKIKGREEVGSPAEGASTYAKLSTRGDARSLVEKGRRAKS